MCRASHPGVNRTPSEGSPAIDSSWGRCARPHRRAKRTPEIRTHEQHPRLQMRRRSATLGTIGGMVIEQFDDAVQPVRDGSWGPGCDIGAACLRFILGILFLGHGLQKLGWFKGPGWPASIDDQAAFVGLFGYSHTQLMAWLVTLTEVASGTLAVLGLLTPFAAAGMIGIEFQFAAGPQWSGGLFGSSTSSGLDQTLLLMFAAAALGFIGAGRYSLDARFLPARLALRGWRAGLSAVVLGVVIGAIVLAGLGVGLGGHPAIPQQ
jgi:putative oxidoreductase